MIAARNRLFNRAFECTRAPLSNGQPPSPGTCIIPENLSACGEEKCRDKERCPTVRTLTAKYSAPVKQPIEGASWLRLHRTSGGSSDTAAKELAVRPANWPERPRVVITATPVANRPSAVRRVRVSVRPQSSGTAVVVITKARARLRPLKWACGASAPASLVPFYSS
jgi:hypothetical protein